MPAMPAMIDERKRLPASLLDTSAVLTLAGWSAGGCATSQPCSETQKNDSLLSTDKRVVLSDEEQDLKFGEGERRREMFSVNLCEYRIIKA